MIEQFVFSVGVKEIVLDDDVADVARAYDRPIAVTVVEAGNRQPGEHNIGDVVAQHSKVSGNVATVEDRPFTGVGQESDV